MWGPSGCHLCLSGLVMWGPHGQPRSPPLCTYGARLAHMGPSRVLHRSDLTGPIWAMWFKWASGIWDPCGQPQIDPMWASGIWDPCGQPQMYPIWASGIWDPCGQPQIYPMWASGMWDPCGLPRFIPYVLLSGHLSRALSLQDKTLLKKVAPNN